MPSNSVEAVDKASSILLLSPSLALARAFLSGFFVHCGLPLPDDVPSFGWAGRARWAISNKYYEAEVSFVLRQVSDEHDTVGATVEDDVDNEGELEGAALGYPAVLHLVSAAQLRSTEPFRVPREVRTAFAEERPDVSLAFALVESDGDPVVSEGREEAVLESFLDLGIEFISSTSSQSIEADEAHTPPPFEQVVQSLSSHMWPSLTLKLSTNGNSVDPAPQAHVTISALAGLLGGMGGFGLPPGVDDGDGTDGANDADSDFSDDDGQPFDAGYATLDGSNDDDAADFGDFETAPSLDSEHRLAGLEIRSALAFSSTEVETVDGSSEPKHVRWETFDALSSVTHPTIAQPTQSDTLLDSFDPSVGSTLSPWDPHPPERKFSSSFVPSPTSPAGPTATAETEDSTADLGAMLSHLSSLRTELAGVEDDDERRRRAAAAVMALFGDDFDGEDEP